MRKRISLKTRRPDLSQREFRTHYEQHHVPLGLSFIDRFRWRRYVRNHVLAVTGSPIHFDCYAEFWVDDDFDDASLEAFVGSPEFRVLDEDDRRFLDVTKRMSFDVRETICRSRRDADPILGKAAVVWPGASQPVEESIVLAQRIVDSLGDRVIEAILDRSLGAIPPRAPFDTLLTLRLGDAEAVAIPPAVAPGDHWSMLRVDAVETQPALLYVPDVGDPNDV